MVKELAKQTIEVFKNQPLTLSLVLMNLGLLALFYVIVRSAEHRHQMVADQQRELVILLGKCVP